MAKKSKIRIRVEKHHDLILNGRVLSIDPSIGSKDSQPGYAIHEKGELVEKGILTVPYYKQIEEKLASIGRQLREKGSFDVLVMENIPARMKGKQRTPPQLHKAIGGVLASAQYTFCVYVAPISWRKYCPANYHKTDANDAEMMGFTVIQIAREIQGLEIQIMEDMTLD